MPGSTAVEGPAYRQVADRLRHLILSGELTPGERLPVEAVLADQFGVSRSTVREALRSLASENMVETTRGVTGGTFVRQPHPGQVADTLGTGLELLTGSDAITVTELLEARELLEVPAARLAAVRRTEEQLVRLDAALPEPRRVLESRSFEVNRTFHAIVLEASGNRLLEVMTRPLFVVLQTRFLRDAAPARFWRRVDVEHRSIADAIAAGDERAAAQEMSAHLVHLRATYEKIDRSGRR